MLTWLLVIGKIRVELKYGFINLEQCNIRVEIDQSLPGCSTGYCPITPCPNFGTSDTTLSSQLNFQCLPICHFYVHAFTTENEQKDRYGKW